MGKDYQMSDCRAFGLNGLPVVVSADKRYGLESLSMLLLDVGNEVITGGRYMITAKNLLSEQYASTFEVVAFVEPASYQVFLQGSPTLDHPALKDMVYGLACIKGPSLTIPEREAASAIVDIAKLYLPPIKRDNAYTFPTVLDDFIKRDDEMQRRCLPWKALNEFKAYEVAEVLTRLYGVDTRVFQDGDDYYVSADHSQKLAANMDRLIAQLELLRTFDLRLTNLAPNFLEPVDPDALDGITCRADRAFRIEDSVNAILARLEQPAVQNTVDMSAPASKGRGIAALIPSSTKPAGKKASSKKSA